MPVPGDNPIKKATDDSLGRASIAASLARRALTLDRSEGLVVGVLGPWGSGKTTFVNLARPELEEASEIVVDFNPWMFSGAEQLVESFFVELSAQLKIKPNLRDLGEDLAEYGETFAGLGWLPVVGPWIERGRGAAKVLGKYLRRRREGSQGRRQKLIDALKQLERPIVVILDDIDRLSSSEIRDTFRLVRLTASFPNVIYVVAFDRVRVEQALSEDGVPGRDYLEKILQVAVDLPAVSQEVLIHQITQALDEALSETTVRDLDAEVWPDILMEVIWPLIGNMRDVRRYAAAVHTTIETIGDQIAIADLLAMEAIRVFLPDLYAQVQVSIDALCTPSPGLGGSPHETSTHKESIEKLLEVAKEEGQEAVAKAMITRLFPFARRHIENYNYGSDFLTTFLRERRIAHKAVLELYLERVAGSQLLSFTYAEEAWERFSDEPALEEFLRSVPEEYQETAIASLEGYEDDFAFEHAVAGAPVLLNLLGDLPERPRGMFDLDSRTVVVRVVYRLLRSLNDQGEVAEAVTQIDPKLRSLSAKFELLTVVGYRENAGHKLISVENAEAFEAAWRQEVREAEAQALVDEDELTRVIYWTRKDAAQKGEEGVDLPPNPEVTLAILRSARSENRGQTEGRRAVRRTAVFAWSTLVELYGDEGTLIARINELKESGVEIEASLEELIDKYLGGWRPRDFNFDDEDDE